MNRNRNRIIIIIFAAFAMLLLSSCAANPELAAPGVTLSVTPDGQPQQVTSGVQLFVLSNSALRCTDDTDSGNIFHPHRYRSFDVKECDRYSYHSSKPGGHRSIAIY